MSFHTIVQARVRLHRSELAVPAIQRIFDRTMLEASRLRGVPFPYRGRRPRFFS